jgi:hypothetical protein
MIDEAFNNVRIHWNLPNRKYVIFYARTVLRTVTPYLLRLTWPKSWSSLCTVVCWIRSPFFSASKLSVTERGLDREAFARNLSIPSSKPCVRQIIHSAPGWSPMHWLWSLQHLHVRMVLTSMRRYIIWCIVARRVPLYCLILKILLSCVSLSL